MNPNKFMLGKKIGMTQLMDDEGVVSPVTVIEVNTNTILTIKTKEADGYSAVVVGYGDVAEKRLNKPKVGQFKLWNAKPVKVIKEFRVSEDHGFEKGQTIDVSVFEKDQKVSVKGRTIGKGFAGTVKRWNFACGPMTHGSKSHRITGSIGAGTTPGRVLRGKKMPGHMGDKNRTIKNLVVVGNNVEKGLLYVKGAVPGKKGNLIEVTST